MKLSRYNIIVHREDKAYWFNSLTHNYFKISLSLSDKIFRLLTERELLPIYMVEKLTRGGFIVEDSVDEIEKLKALNQRARDSKDYFLVILPTLNCNYHCWYCIQDHIESKMTFEVMSNLKRHIDYMIEIEKITSLHIDWFGGEPFLYFNDIVKPLTEYAKNRCEKAGISFYASSTTNGYYLTDTISADLSDLNFINFQITLDGNKEFHDKVKFLKGCDSTFTHVLKNINRLLTENKKVNIFLRINYTHKNLTDEIVDQVSELIMPTNRNRIIIVPRKVWQEKIKGDYYSELLEILDKFRDNGYKVEYWNQANNFIPCYVNKKYYNSINYNGHVIKCTACNDLYESDPKGILMNNGMIKWKGEYDEMCYRPTFDNDHCINCNKLPICMGLCPRENLKNNWYCKEKVMDTTFEDSIVGFIERS